MRARHQVGRIFGAVALVTTVAAMGTATAGATDDQLGDGPPPEQSQLQATVSTAATTGPTVFFYDQYGNGVFAVYSGEDLNRYLYRSGGPIDFSIDVDRDFGPVDADGHPTADHPLAGKFGTVSIRAWDVDDTYDGGTIAPEIDTVTVNGTEIGTLTGADSQWSYTTVQLPLDLLRFPTADNPTGRNDFQVHIDTGNTSEQWAVEIASVELRITDEELPVVFNHGFGGSDNDLADMETSFLERLPAIQGRTERTTVTKRGSIRENADLLQTQIDEFLTDSGSFATNAVAHSMGGLNTRLYAFDNPGRISRFVMMGTPNGGTRIADLLCGVHRQRSWNPAILAAQAGLRRLFGNCTQGDGLYQLQQSYVQDVFNPQVPDNPASYYGTIAGKGRDIRNILLDGEDDGLVTVDSVQYLSRHSHPERAGLHWNLGVFDVNHTGLLQGQGDHATKTFCGVYPGACIPVIGPRSAVSATLAPAEASLSTPEWSWTAATTVPAGGTVDVPLEFEGAANAAVLVLADDPNALSGTVSGAPLQSGQLLDVGILQAAVTSPGDGALTLSLEAPMRC